MNALSRVQRRNTLNAPTIEDEGCAVVSANLLANTLNNPKRIVCIGIDCDTALVLRQASSKSQGRARGPMARHRREVVRRSAAALRFSAMAMVLYDSRCTSYCCCVNRTWQLAIAKPNVGARTVSGTIPGLPQNPQMTYPFRQGVRLALGPIGACAGNSDFWMCSALSVLRVDCSMHK